MTAVTAVPSTTSICSGSVNVLSGRFVYAGGSIVTVTCGALSNADPVAGAGRAVRGIAGNCGDRNPAAAATINHAAHAARPMRTAPLNGNACDRSMPRATRAASANTRARIAGVALRAPEASSFAVTSRLRADGSNRSSSRTMLTRDVVLTPMATTSATTTIATATAAATHAIIVEPARSIIVIAAAAAMAPHPKALAISTRRARLAAALRTSTMNRSSGNTDVALRLRTPLRLPDCPGSAAARIRVPAARAQHPTASADRHVRSR